MTTAEILATVTLRAGFNSAVVVAGTACLGIAAGVIGSFMLLRKRASGPGTRFAASTASRSSTISTTRICVESAMDA